MSTLSICMPSNRQLSRSLRSIESVISLIKGTRIKFVISDNSGDEKKYEYLSSIQSKAIKVVSGPKTAVDNWKNSVYSADTDYVMVVSDDDLIISLNGSPFESLNNSGRDVIGFRPGFVVFTPKTGVLKSTNFTIQGITAKDRIEAYLKLSNGSNNTLFSAWNKELLLNVYNCLEHHPTKGEYTDWPIVIALLSSGNLMSEPDTVMFYNQSNWFGDKTFIQNEIKRLFSNAGLPPSKINHLPLLQAIDSYILIRRKSSTLPEHEKVDAANFALAAYLRSYIKSSQEFSAIERRSIEILSSKTSVPDVLNAIMDIIKCEFPYLTNSYLYFYYETIGKQWGN